MTKKIVVGYKREIHFAYVDDEDYALVSKYTWTGDVASNGVMYATTYVIALHKHVRMHVMIMQPKSGEEIDHRNHNGLDNRRHKNLRILTRSQNMANTRKKEGSSIYKGVAASPTANKWTAKITKNYEQIHLGTFSSEIEAAKAYNGAAIELFGEYAEINKL